MRLWYLLAWLQLYRQIIHIGKLRAPEPQSWGLWAAPFATYSTSFSVAQRAAGDSGGWAQSFVSRTGTDGGGSGTSMGARLPTSTRDLSLYIV